MAHFTSKFEQKESPSREAQKGFNFSPPAYDDYDSTPQHSPSTSFETAKPPSTYESSQSPSNDTINLDFCSPSYDHCSSSSDEDYEESCEPEQSFVVDGVTYTTTEFIAQQQELLAQYSSIRLFFFLCKYFTNVIIETTPSTEVSHPVDTSHRPAFSSTTSMFLLLFTHFFLSHFFLFLLSLFFIIKIHKKKSLL